MSFFLLSDPAHRDRGLTFVHSDEVKISDNCLDVFPNDPQEVRVEGDLAKGDIMYRWYMDDGRVGVE